MYNQHKWRRTTDWWDSFEIPMDKKKNVFEWISEEGPDPLEHDYLLFTDGSGCDEGWGASAAVIQRVDLNPTTGFREVVETFCLVNATYGSTVQRSEMTAFLDGMHAILSHEIIRVEGSENAETFMEFSKNRPLSYFQEANRPSIWWVTDRANIAKSLLMDVKGDYLNARVSEKDLWTRYAAMARYVCITPQAIERNTIEQQAECDGLCGVARGIMKSNIEALAKVTKEYPLQKWQSKKNQKAKF